MNFDKPKQEKAPLDDSVEKLIIKTERELAELQEQLMKLYEGNTVKNKITSPEEKLLRDKIFDKDTFLQHLKYEQKD